MRVKVCRRCSGEFEGLPKANLCSACKSKCNRCSTTLTKENAYKFGSDVSQCKVCRQEVVKEFKVKTEGSTKAYHRKLNNSRWFNLSSEEFDELRALADYRCEICSKEEVDKNLCVDHCHSTGVIRGYLCKQCNSAIGLLGDNSQSLNKALEYLKSKETKPFKVPEFKG